MKKQRKSFFAFQKGRDDQVILFGSAVVLACSILSLFFLQYYSDRNAKGDSDSQSSNKVLGTIIREKGDVSKRRVSDLIFDDVLEDNKVYNQDTIFVDKDSSAELNLGDIGVIDLSSNTLVVVELEHTENKNPSTSKEEQASERPSARIKLKIEKGEVRINRSSTHSPAILVESHDKPQIEIATQEQVIIGAPDKTQVSTVPSTDEDVQVKKDTVAVPKKADLAKARQKPFPAEGLKETATDRKPAESIVVVEAPSPEPDTSTQGPNYMRREWGIWGQGGASFVTQKINNPGAQSGIGDAGQVALRNGLGAWYKNFLLEGYWREPVVNTTDETFQPRWIQGLIGYNFELPRFSGVTPLLQIFAGWESYRNEGNSEANFLAGYNSPTFGFRSRFILSRRWETGGDVQTVLMGNARKIFIQGDLRYWFATQWALGGGYWIDISRVTASDGFVFNEQSYAVESYIRYVWE